MKKIIFYIYLSIVLTLFLLLGIKTNIQILAVSNIENTLGSYNIQVDYDNYNKDNLYDNTSSNFNLNRDCFVSLSINNNYGVTATSVSNNQYIYCGFIVDYLENGLTYTFKTDIVNNTSSNNEYKIAIFPYENNNLGLEIGLCVGYNKGSTPCKLTFNSNYSRYLVLMYPNLRGSITPGESVDFNNIMIYEGDENKTFAPFFKFGFALDLVINNPNVSNLNTDITINDKACLSQNLSLNINAYNRITTNCFIPFNVNNSGFVSIPSTKILINFNNSNATISGRNSGYILRPVISGNYKGQYTENVYLLNNYVASNFYYDNLSIRTNNNSLLTGIYTTESNGEYNLTEQVNLEVKTYNLISDIDREVKYYNYINFNEFLNFNIGLLLGYDGSVSQMSGLTYYIGLNGISSIVRNNSSISTPIINNTDINNKYKSCSAWYDIPCQLGNAITYIIYEAPIISPIIEFFDNFIDLFNNLVVYLTWFEGLGLIFSIFIAILFIRMIILLVKGGNED